MSRPDSIKTRVAAFFAANPDEELTREMLLEKFGGHQQASDTAVRELRAEGLLESVHVIRLRSKGARRDEAQDGTNPTAMNEVAP